MPDPAVSQTDLFPACVEILRAAEEPIHYRELADKGLAVIGQEPSTERRRDAREDVREKLLERRTHGAAYVGDPLCVGVLQRWFPARQRLLLNQAVADCRVPGSATVATRAAYECLERFPHMRTKVASGAARKLGCARGLVIEHHVSEWVRRRWPGAWLPADNETDWRRGCWHDFKLRVHGRVFLVDVMGPRSDGFFGQPRGGNKTAVDLHLCASIEDTSVVVHGFRAGKELVPTFGALETSPIEWLSVWLNCAQAGLDYGAIRRAVES